MLIGDAARLVYPESGGGIENALFSGRVAGLTAAKYIHGEISSLKNYQKYLRIKILRIKKGYKRKIKASESDRKYIKTYQRICSLMCFINKLFPNFSHYPWITKLEKLCMD
jgi:flavin-dependent dehydrogenase